MPAKSRDQQELFGIVNAIQKGELDANMAKGPARELAKSMKPKDVRKFAKTKHKGLPEKVAKKKAKKKVHESLFDWRSFVDSLS